MTDTQRCKHRRQFTKAWELLPCSQPGCIDFVPKLTGYELLRNWRGWGEPSKRWAGGDLAWRPGREQEAVEAETAKAAARAEYIEYGREQELADVLTAIEARGGHHGPGEWWVLQTFAEWLRTRLHRRWTPPDV